MRTVSGIHTKKRRLRYRPRKLAPCPGVRNHAEVVTGQRPHTRDYPDAARTRLGVIITRTRQAIGYKGRPEFTSIAGVGLTSLVKLETGKPVGPDVYEAVARALPGWTEDTPLLILEGADAPPVMKARREPEVGSMEWIAAQAARLPEEAFLALMIRMAELRRQERTEGRLSDLGVRRTDPNPSETAS